MPREIDTMHYIYVLQSLTDHNFYVGYTNNLKSRLEQHNSGKVTSTKHRGPFKIVYYEACLNGKDALHREKYLKTTYGKRYLRNRLRHYL